MCEKSLLPDKKTDTMSNQIERRQNPGTFSCKKSVWKKEKFKFVTYFLTISKTVFLVHNTESHQLFSMQSTYYNSFSEKM